MNPTYAESSIEFEERNKIVLLPYVLERFKQILRTYDLLNLFFIFLIIGEVTYFLVHFPTFLENFVMAIHFALIVATLFCYLTLKMYFQTRKNEKLVALRDEYLNAISNSIGPLEDTVRYLKIAHHCCELGNAFHSKEYDIFPIPLSKEIFAAPIEKMSCWFHWKDCQLMKEILLQTAIEYHIKIVHSSPTDLDAHAGLANAYVMLSGLFIDPRHVEGLKEEEWIPPNKYNEESRRKFQFIAKMAIEEFKILRDYAPQDPWVHAQLAYSYHDLNMPEQEISEYETLLELCPDDKETLFKLGQLYFKQGLNAKGLQVYNLLKESNHKKAETLIHFYGAYSLRE